MSLSGKTLSAVLLGSDLPPEELCAARLDGELFAVDEGFAHIDSTESAEMRAASLSEVVPPRLIAELATAAWIHGARDRPPSVHEFCIESTSRYRDVGLRRVRLREVSLLATETETMGLTRITTPLRTVIDLLRCRDAFAAEDADSIHRLSEAAGLSRERISGEIARRRHLPAKLRALERLERLSLR